MDVASVPGVDDVLKRAIVYALLGACSCSLNLRLVPVVEVKVGAEVGVEVRAEVGALVEATEPEVEPFQKNIFMKCSSYPRFCWNIRHPPHPRNCCVSIYVLFHRHILCTVYRCLTTVSTLQRTSIFMLSHELVVRLFSYIYLYISLC